MSEKGIWLGVIIGAALLVAYLLFKSNVSTTASNHGPGGVAGSSSGNAGALGGGPYAPGEGPVGSATGPQYGPPKIETSAPDVVVNPMDNLLSWMTGTSGDPGANAL